MQIKSLPFTARKQKPVNRFKLASILLAIILGFSLYQGTSAVVNYLGSPTNPAQKNLGLKEYQRNELRD